MDTYHDLYSYSSSLNQRENMIKSKVQQRIRTKIFFRWFDGYFHKLEETYRPFTNSMKIKVFKGLFMEKR